MKGTEFLNKLAVSITPVGSRVTCNPPPKNTDEDYLVLVPEKEMGNLRLAMKMEGATYEGDEKYTCDAFAEISPFLSFRIGNLNFIVSTDSVFHERFLAASARAKELNLMLKSERVALFQTVLYGAPYAQRKPY